MNERQKTFNDKEKFAIDYLLIDMYFEKFFGEEIAKKQLTKYDSNALLSLLKEHILIYQDPVDLYIMSLPEIHFDKGLNLLIDLFQHENATIRFYVCQTLGFYKDERAIEALVSALQDNDIDVKGQAILSLGNMEDKRVLPLLTTMISEPQAI